MERFFGIASTASQSQQQRRLPPLGFPLQLIPGEAQHNDRAENLFLHGISKPGVFEEEMSSLDEKDADTVGRLLCWAVLKNKHPDVIGRLGAKCGDVGAPSLRGLPPLFCAVVNRHANVVKQLLAMRAPVNVVSKHHVEVFSCTPLHCAVRNGDAGIVKSLLIAGANVDFADDIAGQTALHTACETADVAVAVELLKHGADVNKTNKFAQTPLDAAVALNNYPIMKAMITLGKKPSAMTAADLVEQCRGKAGWEEMFELLVESGWGPRDRKSRVGNNPLMGFTTPVSPASSASAAAAAAAAAKGGASSSRSRAAPPPRADSALHRAVRSRDCDRLEELLGSGQDPSATDVCGRGPLHVAARLGNVEVVQILLRAKAAVDARDKASLTPLLTASKEGKAEVVEALLKGGAAPNLKDSRGHSALFNAVELRFLAVVKALVSGGASVNAGGQKGLTPLHLACEQGPVSIVEVLLSAGALPGHCWNDTLRSPLFGACIAGSLDAVNLLLPLLSKRQINMRDRMLNLENAGSTALMTAIMCNRGEMDIIQALLDKGADPTIRTAFNHMSPLEQAVVYEGTGLHPVLGPRLVRALIKAGAEVDEIGPQGCTVLHHACCEGACGEVVQALLDAGADARAPCAGLQFMTPLQLAGCGGNRGALRVLLGLPELGGLDAVGAPPERATVLACAVKHGATEGVRYLLEEGADMDLLPFEEDGITPRAKSLVHLAMAGGHGDIIALLLQAKRFKKQKSELLARGV